MLKHVLINLASSIFLLSTLHAEEISPIIEEVVPSEPETPIEEVVPIKVAEPIAFEKLILLAREFRIDPSLSIEDDLKRRTRILDEACSVIPRYENQENLLETAIAFVQDSLWNELSDLELVITDVAETDLGGKCGGHSGDSVFLVTKGRKLLYVVKAFCDPRSIESRFLPEISALDFILQLKLPQVTPIRPLAFATCKIKNAEYGLLLETGASGKRLDQYLYDLRDKTLGYRKRQILLYKAQKGFTHMGESLAHLHRTKSAEPSRLSPSIIGKIEEKASKIANQQVIVDALTAGISMEDFQNYLEKVVADVKDMPIYLSFWHGDAHIENIVYDYKRDLFSFIDVANLYKSVDINGNPLVDGTLDLMRAEENMRRRSWGVLTKDEILSVLNAFYKGYKEVAGELPDQRLLNFYKTDIKLGRLLQFARYDKSTDPLIKAEEKALFELAVHFFTQRAKPKKSSSK